VRGEYRPPENNVPAAHANNEASVQRDLRDRGIPAPGTNPDKTGVVEKVVGAQNEANIEINRAKYEAQVSGGAAVAATAIYADRQSGVSRVVNSRFFGMNTASQGDYALALERAAANDPELRSRLQGIGASGGPASEADVAWIQERADRALTGSERFGGKKLAIQDATGMSMASFFDPKPDSGNAPERTDAGKPR
jgi:hypothetical protein